MWDDRETRAVDLVDVGSWAAWALLLGLRVWWLLGGF